MPPDRIALTGARQTLAYLLGDIDWQPQSISRRRVERSLRACDAALAKSPRRGIRLQEVVDTVVRIIEAKHARGVRYQEIVTGFSVHMAVIDEIVALIASDYGAHLAPLWEGASRAECLAAEKKLISWLEPRLVDELRPQAAECIRRYPWIASIFDEYPAVAVAA